MGMMTAAHQEVAVSVDMNHPKAPPPIRGNVKSSGHCGLCEQAHLVCAGKLLILEMQTGAASRPGLPLNSRLVEHLHPMQSHWEVSANSDTPIHGSVPQSPYPSPNLDHLWIPPIQSISNTYRIHLESPHISSGKHGVLWFQPMIFLTLGATQVAS